MASSAMYRQYFVHCDYPDSDPFGLVVEDVINELRQRERLIYEVRGYNEAQARENIVSVSNTTIWSQIHHFANTAKSVLRTYALHACNLSHCDVQYASKIHNVGQIMTTIRHDFTPVPEAQAMRFITEFDRLFPPFAIREKLLTSDNASLAGKLTVMEWDDGGISTIHRIECTVSIKITQRNEDEIHVEAKPHVLYYKINVKKLEEGELEGEKCSQLLTLLERHRTGRDEYPGDNDADGDNGDEDEDADSENDGDNGDTGDNDAEDDLDGDNGDEDEDADSENDGDNGDTGDNDAEDD